MNTVKEYCREWVEEKAYICSEPADVIFWGKLFGPEIMGPRCEKHADDWIYANSNIGVNGVFDAIRQGWAIFDLRGLYRLKRYTK